MKITAKSRYALRILLDIAAHDSGAPRPIREISVSQGISEKFIGRLAVPLRRAGLVESERGARGGLRLARFPEKITLLAIVQATDGPLALLRCLSKPGACKKQGSCAAELAWKEVNEALSGALEKTTLADVLAAHRRIFGQSDPAPEPDYCI
ncbi:MAG: Rrf2 family transcriptional regulator [Kiritimatiellae bacterium]|nr:Rrf2 family transcriptional regulator [Kiritimatiellia bacterium]MBR1835982.1 Rrf2 family transcriptional regulator [Kiritimatiellia bacterium]